MLIIRANAGQEIKVGKDMITVYSVDPIEGKASIAINDSVNLIVLHPDENMSIADKVSVNLRYILIGSTHTGVELEFDAPRSIKIRGQW